MVKQDGTIFWAQVEISYSLGDKKEYQARILISDISERKRIENLLQITEKRLSVLAEYSRVIFWEVDAEGLYNYISPTCLSILGYTSVEISAKKYFYDLHPDEGRAAFKVAAFEQIDRQLPFRNFENMLQTKDGQVIWVSTNALPILDENGKLTGYSGVDIDITEHKLVAAAVVEREASKREQAALAKADAERRLLLDNIQTQVWYLTDDHTYGRVNVAHAAFIGVSKERLAFKSMYDFVQNDRLDHFIQDVKQVFATGQAIHSELRLPNADGEWRLLKILTSAILNADGLVRQVVCSADDITERKQAEEALRYAHWKLESTIEGTHVGTWEWNVQTGETTFNEIWAQMLGYSLAELAPISIKTWEMLNHPDDLIRSGELLAHHFMGKSLYYECEPRMKHKDGHWVWIQDRGRVVTWTEDNKPLLMLGIHTDISVRKASEEKIRLLNIELENLTLTDFLTNLFNRRYFMLRGTEAVKRVMRNTEPLSLLMLDIDLFKKVNDNYGHEVGDLALQHVARVLKSCLREIDILARIGGEEFAVLLPNMGQAEAAILAERVRKLIQDTPFETGGKAIAITISLGAAVFENGMAAIDDLLRNADAALYEAKRSGRNCVVIFGDNLPPPTEGK
ncbi:MAG: diguanylate cyclase [Chloroflexi bacterium]|nr:diguanylate cyclase [Chloroflexota bacterium]